MKLSFLRIVALSLVLLCCRDKDDDNVSIIGTWKLSAQLIDPGDGSGRYQYVDSDKTITFYTNGTYASNGSFCNLNSDSDQSTTGVYIYTNTDKNLKPTCSIEVEKIKLNIEYNYLIMSNFGMY